jgi:hypothetical protein
MQIGKALLFVGLFSSVALAQVQGRFYLEKKSYARGEPVYLFFEAKNDSDNAVEVVHADPYSFCSGFTIHISSDVPPDSSCTPRGFAGSCLSSVAAIGAHKTGLDRILLNYEHDLHSPGTYEITAEKRFAFSDRAEELYRAQAPIIEVRDNIVFTVEEAEATDAATVTRLVSQLKSKDEGERREAARALAAVAPRSEEELLLDFAKRAEFRQFAPLALHNLDTDRSWAAMAELFAHAEPGSYESGESARYLGNTGDPKWFPILKAVAQTHSFYMGDAARSGGEQALPMILLALHSSTSAHWNAVDALGETGTRSAVPIAIEMLRSPEEGISARALYALHSLTHMQAGLERFVEHPELQYKRWADWWAENGKTATIYRSTQCGPMTQLP